MYLLVHLHLGVEIQLWMHKRLWPEGKEKHNDIYKMLLIWVGPSVSFWSNSIIRLKKLLISLKGFHLFFLYIFVDFIFFFNSTCVKQHWE